MPNPNPNPNPNPHLTRTRTRTRTLTLAKAVLALSRGAVVSSMCWLRRLSETKKRRTYGEGEVQAMDWGLTQCGRDVTEIGRYVLPSPSPSPSPSP